MKLSSISSSPMLIVSVMRIIGTIYLSCPRLSRASAALS
jgi:hypothetical protein